MPIKVIVSDNDENKRDKVDVLMFEYEQAVPARNRPVALAALTEITLTGQRKDHPTTYVKGYFPQEIIV